MLGKYNRIVGAITDNILSGKYVPLGPIPSERALMEQFGAARATVRKALEILDSQGMIYRSPGRATVVSGSVIGAKTRIGVMISGCMYTEIFRAVCNEIGKLAELERVEAVFGDSSRDDFDHSGAAAYKVAKELVEKKIKGVILQPVQFSRSADEINRNLVRIFRDAGIEVVLIDSDFLRSPGRGDLDLVGIDNFNAGRLAALHAVKRGAKKITFIARKGCADTVHERWHGVKSVSDRVPVEGLYLDSVSEYPQIRKALSRLQLIDTVICQNDIAAMNVCTVLKSMGLNVPSDVMLIGFDDVVMASKMSPGLTTVHQPCDDIAEQAFHRLLARIANPGLHPVRIQCRESLVVRGSTERLWR